LVGLLRGVSRFPGATPANAARMAALPAINEIGPGMGNDEMRSGPRPCRPLAWNPVVTVPAAAGLGRGARGHLPSPCPSCNSIFYQVSVAGATGVTNLLAAGSGVG
jgi:hypothetical protein